MSLSKDNYCKLVVRMLALDSVIKFDYKSSKVKYSLFFFPSQKPAYKIEEVMISSFLAARNMINLQK